ncbi:MAG: energy transducer TonB [Chitinophagaceae bacterium]|nr:energy transducer TonB [Chitinophagaceae bacterium]MBL0057410.1 energy transducer TonB [Chitinophagaceae bacterium]
MDTNKILSADVLDIIFEGRNKSYGAYDLRKTYNRRLTRALLYTAALALLIFLGTVFASVFKKKDSDKLIVRDTQLAEIKKDAPPPPPPPPPPPKAPPPPEINQVKFTPPKIVKDEEVKPDEKIEEIKEDQVISTKTVESENKQQVVQAPVEDKGTQIVEVKKEDDENKIFNKVEVEAAFPGGDAAWRNYLQKNLNGSVPVDNGAGEGTFTVIVKFVVSRDGSLSDVSCESDPGFGMCQEAIRVIKKTKNWTPAIQNGRNVNAYRRQPITFLVEAN